MFNRFHKKEDSRSPSKTKNQTRTAQETQLALAVDSPIDRQTEKQSTADTDIAVFSLGMNKKQSKTIARLWQAWVQSHPTTALHAFIWRCFHKNPMQLTRRERKNLIKMLKKGRIRSVAT